MLQVSWKNPAKISFSWTLEGLAYIQLANAPDMHPSLQVWCVQRQLVSSTQIHRTTISSLISSYPTINEDGSCFPQPQDGRLHFLLHPHHAKRGGKKKKKKLRMALNGTDCKADTGISNSKCISYVKSWINSEYDSMHIHIKLKSQPEPRFRAVFFGSFSSIRPWFEIVWIPLHSIVLSEGTA